MTCHEISMEHKKNLHPSCIPFCLEHLGPAFEDSLRLHIHDYQQLTVITRGSGILVLNGVSYPIRAGDVYVIDSFSAHYLKEVHGLELVNLLFYLKDQEAAGGSLVPSEGFQQLFHSRAVQPGAKPSNIFSMDYKETERVSILLDRLLEEQRSREPGSELMIQSGFMMLITYLTRICQHHVAHTPAAYSAQLQQAVQCLEDNYTQSISLADLSRLCQMTERQLRTLFDRVYDCTPLQYLWNIRIRKACYYLASTTLPIAEIAAMTGFDDNNYFSRKFRQSLGMTPRDYRSQARAPA